VQLNGILIQIKTRIISEIVVVKHVEIYNEGKN